MRVLKKLICFELYVYLITRANYTALLPNKSMVQKNIILYNLWFYFSKNQHNFLRVHISVSIKGDFFQFSALKILCRKVNQQDGMF